MNDRWVKQDLDDKKNRSCFLSAFQRKPISVIFFFHDHIFNYVLHTGYLYTPHTEMEVVCIKSENTTLLCITNFKILLICHTVLFYETPGILMSKHGNMRRF